MNPLFIALGTLYSCQPSVTHLPAPDSFGSYKLSEVYVAEGHLFKGDWHAHYAFEGKSMVEGFKVPFQADSKGLTLLLCKDRQYTVDLVYKSESLTDVVSGHIGPKSVF